MGFMPHIDNKPLLGYGIWEINAQYSEIIMLGDFNAVFNIMVDRSRESSAGSFPPNFYHYVVMLPLVDIWQKANPTIREYICFSGRHLTCSRIDYILVTEGLVSDLGISKSFV